MLSGNSQIITEEEMDGRNVPVRVYDVQSVELRVFIRDPVLFQCFLHVQRSAQSLPDVAASMLIEFQVAVQYLSDRLFGRHLQNGTVIIDHVYNAYPSGLFGETTYDIFRVLPPLHLAFGIHMQVLSCWTVKFTSASLQIDSDSWLATIGIEPVCDIRACSLDERSGQRIRNVFLDDSRQIVHLSEENDPAIVGNVVTGHFFQSVIALFLSLHGQELFEVVLGWPAHTKLYNQLITQIVQNMKINSTSKFVPNFFHAQQDDFDNFETQPIPAPFRQIENILKPTSSKSNRKDRTPKIFLEISSQTQQETEIQFPQGQIEENRVNQCQQEIVPTFLNGIKHSKMILNADFEESSSDPEDICEKIVQPQSQEIVNLPAANGIGILRNNWSCNSENTEKLSTKATQDTNRRKVQVQEQATNTSQLQSINIFQPINKGQTRCLLRRDKKSASGFIEYNLYLQGSLQHLLTARKEGMWQYCIYLRQVSPNGSNSFTYTKIATLQSNFLGNKYTLIKEKEKYSSVTICYETNILGLSGPRKFFVYLPKTTLPYEYLNECYENGKHKDKIEKCVSKTAKWSEKVQSYVLNLNGRAKESSIKNFVLTDIEQRDENNFVIFGKVGPDVYNLDIQNPYNILQGLAVALTAFERKLTCD